MDRRKFLQNGLGGLSILAIGSALAWAGPQSEIPAIHVQTLKFRITDAIKEMVNHNSVNSSRCYFWVFKEERFPADSPGPIVLTTEGDLIEVSVTNDLDENHAFFIKGVFDSGPIAPGETRNFSFVAPKGGTYLYYDNLNHPVNRVMGLHGALVVMPKKKVPGQKFTPYSDSTTEVQRLFNDLGNSHFQGLSWEEGDPSTKTPAFRQHVWILHEASPRLFAEVGDFTPGLDYPAEKFRASFQRDRYAHTFRTGKFNKKPHYFTINGQSGFFSHHNPFITPWRRVGEPVVIRILNAGLYLHSLHIHANHFYLLSVNNKAKKNLLWIDTYHAEPLEIVDWMLPVRRPPDVPNTRGIGLSDPPLIGVNGRPVWPPVEEMNLSFPGSSSPLRSRQSPLCYPMHDHIESSQTAQGGNYNMGMMSGIVFTGDRNVPGHLEFPEYPHEFDGAGVTTTQSAAPDIPHSPHHHPVEGDIPYADWELEDVNHDDHGGH